MLFFGWQGVATFVGMSVVVITALYVFVKAMNW